MKNHARVVVIGGGVGGCSTLYHLTQLGWTDVVLVERDELTSGSTWHAAGQVTQFGTVQSMVGLKRYSTQLYAELAKDPAHPINYHITGGVRLATTDDHIDGYKHFIGMARCMGVEFELFSPEQIKQHHPLMNIDGLKGALWDPVDGDIDPSQLTQALAHRARQNGAEIYRFNPVTGLEKAANGEWIVKTKNGDISCEIIVNATGYRVNEVGKMIGVEHPVISMEHQYFVTESMPELQALDFRVPIIRDPSDDFYSRQEHQGLLVGIYEQDCKTWGVGKDGIAENFSMDLLPDDMERLSDNLERVINRLPALATAGISRNINGPITYSADGVPLIGKIPNIRNAYACLGIRAGIGEGGGLGKCLAEIIVHGKCEWDMWALDPRRFTAHANTTYTALKAIEEYQNEFVFHLPYEHRPAGRLAKTTPLYNVLKYKGAHFAPLNGWERAAYFKPKKQRDFKDLPSFRHTTWFDIVAKECRVVRERVGIMEINGFSRFAISGHGAAEYLDSLICGRLPAIGRVGLCYFCSEQGHIVSEMTVSRLADDQFWLISAAAAEYHDLQWLSEHLPDKHSIHIQNLTGRYDALAVTGPKARQLLSKITTADLDNPAFPWLSWRDIKIGFTDVKALRVSFTGELGWELHVPMEHVLSTYDLIEQAGEEFGLVNFGLYTLDSLRLEKGYFHWKHELITERTPFETGLDRFVRLSKTRFIGREALQQQQTTNLNTRLVYMTVDCDIASAHSGAPVYHGEHLVGSVTSGGYGHTTRRNIAMAFVAIDAAKPGTELNIEIIGNRYRADVLSNALYDNNNDKLRV